VTAEKKPRAQKRTVAEQRADLVDRIERCKTNLLTASTALTEFDKAIRERASALLAELPKE
jgi:hypothetical protein